MVSMSGGHRNEQINESEPGKPLGALLSAKKIAWLVCVIVGSVMGISSADTC
ncbi:MAG: hypothetical protein GY917_12785 [Planctomycetaceae bacterium]|nr:hypothetical protein [Planctomycetaceae bacterium]